MAKYFKVKSTYSKVDKEKENGFSNVSKVILFEAVDYIDAQRQAFEKINREDKLYGDSFDLEIQKISYDMVLYRGSEGRFKLKFVKDSYDKNNIEETYWYDIRITRVIEDDKGNEKYITTKYLVEGQNLEDSIKVIRSYLEGENEEYWWFSSIQETPIQEVILSNIEIQ